MVMLRAGNEQWDLRPMTRVPLSFKATVNLLQGNGIALREPFLLTGLGDA